MSTSGLLSQLHSQSSYALQNSHGIASWNTHSSLIYPGLPYNSQMMVSCDMSPNPKQINSGKETTSPYPPPTMQDTLLPPSSNCSKNTQTSTQNPCFQGPWVFSTNNGSQINLPPPFSRPVTIQPYAPATLFQRGVANSVITAGTPADE
jgi:hypothetical protein